MSLNRPLDLRLLGRIAAVLALVASSLTITLLVAAPANATHSRATQLTWTKTSSTTVEFHSVVSYRASYFGSPTVGDTISEPCLMFGDGDSTCGATVETLDPVNDVLTAELTATHTYPDTGPYTAEIDSCCRLSPPLHVNNPDGNYRAVTTVDLSKTSANPVSSISPIVDCPLEAICSFSVPAVDPDGGAIRYRLATGVEADVSGGFVQPGPPHATNAASINSRTGVYSWDTTGATLNTEGGDTFYSTQVVIENLASDGSVVTQSPVDFFIRLTSSGNQQPVFTPPTPADGTVIAAYVGQPVTFAVQAADPDAGDAVSLALLGKPGGATFSSTPGNPASGTFSWTPSANGQAILTVTAADQHGLQATQRSVVIDVGGTVGAPPTMTGRAYGLSADLGLLGQSSVLIAPTVDTGSVSTTSSMAVEPECARSPYSSVLCASFTADAATRSVEARASLASIRLAIPATSLPPYGSVPEAELVIKAAHASSATSCSGSVGEVEIGYLKIGKKVLIGGPTSVAPNRTYKSNFGKIVLNEQVPASGPGQALKVNAVHIYIGSPATLATDIVLASATSGIRGC
jgi:hypothetical protein